MTYLAVYAPLLKPKKQILSPCRLDHSRVRHLLTTCSSRYQATASSSISEIREPRSAIMPGDVNDICVLEEHLGVNWLRDENTCPVPCRLQIGSRSRRSKERASLARGYCSGSLKQGSEVVYWQPSA